MSTLKIRQTALIAGVVIFANSVYSVAETNGSFEGVHFKRTVGVGLEEIERQRQALRDKIERLASIGSDKDDIIGKLNDRFQVAMRKGLLGPLESALHDTTLRSDTLDLLERNKRLSTLLVEGKKAYADIEQSRAMLVLRRIGRVMRQGKAEGASGAQSLVVGEVDADRLAKVERLLENVGPEQPFFEKAREHWKNLVSAVRLDVPFERSVREIDFEKAERQLEYAQQFGVLCRILRMVDEVRTVPGVKFDEFMRKEGIEREIESVKKELMNGKLIGKQRLKDVRSKVFTLSIVASAARKADGEKMESGGER